MRLAIHLAVVIALLYVTSAASAMQDDEDRSGKTAARDARGDRRKEPEELGATLKAAVLSGILTEEEAGEIHNAVIVSLWNNLKGLRAGDGKEAGLEDEKQAEEVSPKQQVLRLSAPRPRQIRALFRPELLARDLAILRADLELDRNQTMIAELLLRDYLEDIDLASSPLRQALTRHRGTFRDLWLAAGLERTDQRLGEALQRTQRVEPEVAVERTQQALERMASEAGQKIDAGDEEGRAKFDAWMKHMIEVSGQLDARLASLRERAAAQLAALRRKDTPSAAEDLVRTAQDLRGERARLRQQLAVDLEIILTEEQRGEGNARLEAVMARIRVDHLLPRGRLGGESMNLWAALTDTKRDRRQDPTWSESLEPVEVMLRQRTAWIADKLEARMEATLDREIEGLMFLAERERIVAVKPEAVLEVNERQLISARRPFAEAARREVMASVAVRDALRRLLDETAASLDEQCPDTGLADAYREASLRRGFPIEMRRRWSERVMAAALELDGLDEVTHKALHEMETATGIELTSLRRDAIAKRIARDPRLAREFIEARLGGNEKAAQWVEDMWLGVNHEAFDAVDDRTAGRLRAILTPEQFAMLPVRLGRGK